MKELYLIIKQIDMFNMSAVSNETAEIKPFKFIYELHQTIRCDKQRYFYLNTFINRLAFISLENLFFLMRKKSRRKDMAEVDFD